MKYASVSTALVVGFSTLAGCSGVNESTDEEAQVEASALLAANALNPNALNPNALNPNALNPNALKPAALAGKALDPNALDPDALAAIEAPGDDADLSRMLLKYTVGCALDTSQVFAFGWTDSHGLSHQEAYPGLLGIAPSWAAAPLDTIHQQMVSACLAARTNFYGVPVIISTRSRTAPLTPGWNDPELAAYPFVEGGFWGNLFAGTPYLRACYDQHNVAHARSLHRDCAAGHLDGRGKVEACGMISVAGSCDSLCRAIDVAGDYYPACFDPQRGWVPYLVTTALP